MAFNAGKWAGLLGGDSAAALQQNPGMGFAGFRSMDSMGDGNPQLFGTALQNLQQIKDELEKKDSAGKAIYSPEEKSVILRGVMSGMPSASDQLSYGILNKVLERDTPEYQEKLLEMADKYQTRKGWKSAMFNTLSSGLDNLTRGIAMSFNPYGTPEAARYAADIVAGSGDRLAAAYAAARTPMAIPAVQAAQAPTYF